MGLLSTAAKLGKTVGKITDNLPVDTKPKSDINPLIKQTEDIFQSPDVRTVEKDYFGTPVEPYEDIIGTMYSPVYSAIENMPIGKKGTKGENISAYLNKRAPNVDKAELESFDINLDPSKRYTREEVLALAKEKGSADYTIEKQKYTEYDDMQRQNVVDKEDEYIELTVQGKQEYTGDPSYVHLGGTNNIGHTRSSIRTQRPEGGPLTQKIKDRPRYLLVEEMQSDLAKVRNDPELNLDTDVDIDKYTDTIRANFSDFKDGLDMDYNISVDNSVLGTVREFYKDLFNPYTIDSLKDIENINADDTYRKLLITKIKMYHNNLDVAGKDLDTVALDAIRKTSDTSRGEINYSSDGDFEFDPEESLEREIKNLLNDVRNDINKLYTTKAKQKDTKKLPVSSRTDYVKRLLLANIAYAKQNNINKIVIPSYKEIAKQRIDSFDELAMSDSLPPALLKKYYKALKDDTVGELAQEYYEGVFKPIYEDSVNKVLNSLKKETKGAIKTKPKKLEYLDASTHPEFRTSDALEIDITDFNYDPTKQGLRFNEGGKVPMMKQMKQFNEGGLLDEGGQVDEVSGNEVPIGSTRKEVRDDIPAQVSEGEFVFPADVVRYLGLEKLMEMRQAAKMGLKQMEAMGQMGNSDEATVPDDMPFGMADLVVIGGSEEEPQEKAYGGMAKKGVPSGMHRMPDGSLMKDSDMSQKKAEGGLFLQSGGSIRMPDFDSSNQDVRIYVKEGSPDRRIPFFDGEPVIPIPAGYVLKGSAPVKTETEEAIPTGGGSDDDPIVPQKTPFQEAGGWDMEFGDPPDAAKVDLWIKEAEKTTGNTPLIATGVAAALGGPLAAFVHLGNKMNAKGRDASFAKALAAAKKTATAGQVAKLNAIDKAIKEGADKNIFNKIIDGISNTLGFGKKEKNIITKVAGNASSSIKQQGKIRPKARPAKLTKEGEEFNKIMSRAEAQSVANLGQPVSDGSLEDLDILNMQIDDADSDPFRFSPSSQFSKGMAEDAAASVATGQTDLELEIFAINKELGISNDVITNSQNSTTTPYEASYSEPNERSLYDTGPISYPIKKTVGIDAPVGFGIIPEMKSDVTTFKNDRQNEYDQLVNANLGFKDAYNNFINQNRFAAQSAQGMKGKTVLRNAVQEQAKTIVDKIVGLVSTKPEEDEIIRSDGTATPFTPRSKQTKPDSVTPDPVTSSSRRDRDPSTSVAEQMQQNRAFNKQQTKGSGNRDIVFKRAIKQQVDAGNTSIEDMQEKAKQTIKGQEKGKGYVGGSGFKKGGLASRRK